MITPPIQEIVWCYGIWQPAYDRLKARDVKFIEGIPDTSDWNVDRRRLIILDDLMSETNSGVTDLFTKGSHHRNMSVIQVTQNLFPKKKEQRTISLNSHYIVVFNPIRAGG